MVFSIFLNLSYVNYFNLFCIISFLSMEGRKGTFIYGRKGTFIYGRKAGRKAGRGLLSLLITSYEGEGRHGRKGKEGEGRH